MDNFRGSRAPDGGWGWAVLLSFALLLSIINQLPAFGLMFGQFLKDHQINTQGFTMAVSIIIATSSFVGLFSNFFIQRWGIRMTGLICVLFYIFGSFATIFVNQFWQLLFFNCFLSSLGRGIMLVVFSSAFNNYWVKRRAFAMAFAQLISGINGILVPLLIDHLLSTYGFRGCLLIIAGLLCHLIPSVAVLKPIKAIDDYPAEPAKPTQEANPMLTESPESQNNPTILAEETKVIDLSMLRDLWTLNLLVGLSTMVVCNFLFVSIQPIYLVSIGLSRANAAYCLSASAFADLLGRLFLMIIGYFYKFKNKNIQLIGTCGTALIQIVYTFRADFMSVLILSALHGFMKAFFTVPLMLVVADQVTRIQFPTAMGLFTFFCGMIMLCFSPVISIFRDRTGSYALIFYIVSGIQLILGLEWIIEKFLVKRNSEKT